MVSDADWEEVSSAITETTGIKVGRLQGNPVGGGCINAAFDAGDGEQRYFVKFNEAPRLPMFEAEAAALAAIGATGSLRVPRPVCHGSTAGGRAFLALEFIVLIGSSEKGQECLGRGLAAMHRSPSPDGRFGWHLDNTIGELPQHNSWSDDWPTFFRDRRLAFQFDLAEANGRRFSRKEELLDAVPAFFAQYSPAPSLLHGDLWGGNIGFSTADDEPVVFDPACYYGDRETDLAFSEMFGGFAPAFYQAYGEAFPLDRGYPERRTLYNLYHLINHHNHFGGGYAARAEHAIDRLLGN